MSRQAVVFVRINNMDTLEVDAQKTFVIDVPENEGDDMEQIIYGALGEARREQDG